MIFAEDMSNQTMQLLINSATGILTTILSIVILVLQRTNKTAITTHLEKQDATLAHQNTTLARQDETLAKQNDDLTEIKTKVSSPETTKVKSEDGQVNVEIQR